MQQPRQPHLAAIHRILRYLKGIVGQGVLSSSNSNLVLIAYCDSDWGTCAESRRFVTGYCLFLGSSPISWQAKKQDVVSRSSSEVKYRSLANTTCEITWLHNLLKDFNCPQQKVLLQFFLITNQL